MSPARTVTIEVTAEDIERGARIDPERCPIALACRRALPDIAVSVDGYGIDEYDLIPTPDVAAKFITSFDTGKTVEPFSFELRIP